MPLSNSSSLKIALAASTRPPTETDGPHPDLLPEVPGEGEKRQPPQMIYTR
jgi:hypothetical protein